MSEVTTPPRPDRTALESLLARVTACDGPNREVDGQLWESLVGPVTWMPLSGPLIAVKPYADVPDLTTSIDDAVGLVSRVLPGWQWMLRGGWAKLWMPNGRPPGNDFDAHAATPALALCAALLRAMIAQSGDG